MSPRPEGRVVQPGSAAVQGSHAGRCPAVGGDLARPAAADVPEAVATSKHDLPGTASMHPPGRQCHRLRRSEVDELVGRDGLGGLGGRVLHVAIENV